MLTESLKKSKCLLNKFKKLRGGCVFLHQINTFVSTCRIMGLSHLNVTQTHKVVLFSPPPKYLWPVLIFACERELEPTAEG